MAQSGAVTRSGGDFAARGGAGEGAAGEGAAGEGGALIGRLAGAILVETRGEFYLVGNPKVPCDLPRAGFEPPPAPIDALKRPWIRLSRAAGAAPDAVDLGALVLALEVEGEAAAALAARRFVIERTGSVSERLWRLVTDPEDEEPARPVERRTLAVRWLGEVPDAVWQAVRDTVLRCS